ncbi:MAG: hypothetical protein ABI947_17855 [Chloroflexota bacterium]
MNPSRVRRRRDLVSVLFAVISTVLALVTLLTLAPIPNLPDLSSLSQGIIQLAVVVGAIAVIIGVLNLLTVHIGKLSNLSSASAAYSGVIVVTFAAVLIVHFLELRGIIKLNLPASAAGQPILTLTLMDVLQVVIESALAGLLFFFLVYSAYRMMRRRVTIWGAVFVAALVIVLIGSITPAGSILTGLRDWLLRVPVSAGTRGLLIGIAIGTITVGVRVLIGQDRLFRE